MNKTTLRAAWLCYRHHCTVPLLLGIPAYWLYLQDGALLPILIMKTATNGLIWYFVHLSSGNRFYYYYNLHASKTLLTLFWFIADIIIFTTIACIATTI